MRGVARWVVLGCVLCVPARAGVTLEVDPLRTTVGDPVRVRMVLESDRGTAPRQQPLGPELGPFSVLEESWLEEAAEEEGRSRWVWSATLAAYRTGELELPALRVEPAAGDGEGWETQAVSVEVASVLAAEEAADSPEIEIADLKPPHAVAPDLGAMWLAGFVLLALLALAGLLWWLNRRYAERFSAVPPVEDPFARIPPHEWAFAELRRLLDEKDRYTTDRFYARIGWILKRYLGGRYRVELLEQTTDEVRPLLEQAGLAATGVARVSAALGDCDAVKFAGYRPTASERKEIVDRVYGIIDQTKPAEGRAADAGRAGAA